MNNLSINISTTFSFKDIDLNNDGIVTEEEYNQFLNDNKIDTIEIASSSNNTTSFTDEDFQKYEQKMKMKEYVNALDATISIDFIGKNSKYIPMVKSLLNDYLDDYFSSYNGDISKLASSFQATLDEKYQELKSTIQAFSPDKNEEKVLTDEELVTEFEQNKNDAKQVYSKINSVALFNLKDFSFNTTNLGADAVMFSKDTLFNEEKRAEEVQTLLDNISAKEQLKDMVNEFTQNLEIKNSSCINNIFDNTYASIVNNKFTMKSIIPYNVDGQGKTSVPELLQNFVKIFLREFEKNLEEYFRSDTPLNMDDIDYSPLNEEQEDTDNNSNITEQKESGYNSYDELKENASLLMDKLKPQFLSKARCYSKLQNIEFSTEKFETAFAQTKEKSLNTGGARSIIEYENGIYKINKYNIQELLSYNFIHIYKKINEQE